jgi:succinyl-diaminopimelate desuccinylase
MTGDAAAPTVVYGPGGKWIAHQAGEFVEVIDIVRCARVKAEAAHRYRHRPDTAGAGRIWWKTPRGEP